MVDIKSNQADAFLRAPPAKLCAVLLFGPDSGLVSERGRNLAERLAGDANNPGEITRYDEADLSADSDRLAVNLQTLPMFGGRSIVRLLIASLPRAEPVVDLLSGPPLAGFLIVEAGNLKADSKLRRAFAASDIAAAVPCYEDDSKALLGIVSEVLAGRGITIAQDARIALMERLGADRALSRNEIEKLALYVGDGGAIALADVEAIIGDAAQEAIDRVVNAVTGRRAKVALAELDRSIAAGESPQTVLIMLMRRLLQLQYMRAQSDGGKPLDSIVRSLRPPVHFKLQDLLIEEVRTWSVPLLARAIKRVQKATKASRSTPSLDQQIVERVLIEVALLGRQQKHTATSMPPGKVT